MKAYIGILKLLRIFKKYDKPKEILPRIIEKPERFGDSRRLRRLVSSSGVWNGGADEKERTKRWTFDLFTTMVDSQWRWTIIFFLASFYVSWLFFAFIYWTIAYYHGDFSKYSTCSAKHTHSLDIPLSLYLPRIL